MRQPDFHKIWLDYFDHPAGKVRYEIRLGGPNERHDLAFMSSLIHDAEFTPKELARSKSTLVVPLDRAAWELWSGANDLWGSKAKLTMSNVRRVDWRIGSHQLPRENKGLSIGWVDLAMRGEEEVELLLIGNSSWQLSVTLDAVKGRILLQDQEVPHR
jgi:hypothetical protein